MFLTLLVIIASLSPNPLENAGCYPRPLLTLVVLLSILVLHLFSLSRILFLSFLSLSHSLYHRFLCCHLLLPFAPPPLSLRTFCNPLSPLCTYILSFLLLSDPNILHPWKAYFSCPHPSEASELYTLQNQM